MYFFCYEKLGLLSHTKVKHDVKNLIGIKGTFKEKLISEELY